MQDPQRLADRGAVATQKIEVTPLVGLEDTIQKELAVAPGVRRGASPDRS